MTSNINRIFSPTDFSKNSIIALRFAAKIASRSGSKLTLLHATQHAMDIAPNYELEREKIIEAINQQFDALVKGLLKDKQLKNLKITTMLLSGRIISNLMEQVELHKPDLIVMGTKGATDDRNERFGSVTTSIVSKSTVPVLIVPSGSTLNNVKEMTFATNFNSGDLEALKQLVDLAGLFDSTVNIVHIAESRSLSSEIKFRGFRELVNELISYPKLHFHLEYEWDFYPGIIDYMTDHPTGLLGMVKYSKSFWESLTVRNHSREMAFYSRVPLLILMGKHRDKFALHSDRLAVT